MLYTENALILSNLKVRENCFKMKLACPKIAERAKPGQFVEIGCGDLNYAPLLKRPISVHNVEKGVLEIIYYVVGQGTDLLSKKVPGEYAETVGSLGNGFALNDTEYHILVGGGYGVPPMYYLAKKLAEKTDPENIFVCLGAREEKLLLCREDFMDLGVSLCVATDDGSFGIKGFVTDSVKMILENNKKTVSLYSCGPAVMMKNLYNLCKDYDSVKDIQCSMEHIMACGVGVCNGCVLKIKENDREIYKRVCKDGPVFRGAEIVW